MKRFLVLVLLLWSGIALANPPGTFNPLQLSVGGPIGTPTSFGTATQSGAGSTSVTFTTTANIVAGNLACVDYTTAGAAGTPTATAVSDGTNSYTQVGSTAGDGSTTFQQQFCKSNASAVASGATVTVTLSGASTGAGSDRILVSAQVSGIIPSGATDQTALQNTTTTSTPTATTGTLSQANEFALGIVASVGVSTYTATNGFAVIGSTVTAANGLAATLAGKTTSSTAAVTLAPTMGTSRVMTTNVATFKGF